MSPLRALRSAALRARPLVLAAGLGVAAWAAGPAPSIEAAPTPPAGDKAAPADPADLGRGLRYLRLGTGAVDESALAAALAAPALVLDLRLATGAAAGEETVRRLRSGRDAGHPLFVLFGADTPAALRALLTAAPGLVTLAAQDSGGAATLLIAVAPAADHAAAEALAAGRPPRELVEEKIEKTRFDEARLAQNHANGQSDAAPGAISSGSGKDAQPAEAAAPLQDLLLQRAIFLHRALLALGRIPEHT